jgi:hypothetical protein
MTIRVTASLIEEVLPPAIAARLSPADLFKIEMELVKHLLRITTYKQYTTALASTLPTTMRKQVRARALCKFDIVVRLKYALLSVLRGRVTDTREQRAVFLRHGLSAHGRLIEGLRRDRVYTKAMMIAKGAQWHFDTPEKVEQACGHMLGTIQTYIEKFAYRKLRFLPKSNNLSLTDITGDLREKAVQTFYLVTPFLSEAHTINSIKRAVHNQGINCIKFYDAAKRKRLHNDGDGNYSNTIISTSAVSRNGDDSGEVDMLNSINSYKHLTDTRFLDLETRISFDSLMTAHGQQPIKNRVLQLLAMQPNPKFVGWVAKRVSGVELDMTPEEIFGQFGRKQYLRLIRKHVKVDKSTFYGFIRTLQASL